MSCDNGSWGRPAPQWENDLSAVVIVIILSVLCDAAIHLSCVGTFSKAETTCAPKPEALSGSASILSSQLRTRVRP